MLIMFSDKPKQQQNQDFVTDFTNVKNFNSNMKGKLSESFAYNKIKTIVSDKDYMKQVLPYQSGLSTPTKQYHVVLTMRVERFFSTLKEDSSVLTNDAKLLLEDEKYIDYFMTCGPNYVRSIRRAQEVTSIFTFNAEDEYLARDFARALRLHALGNRGEQKKRYLFENEESENDDAKSNFSLDLQFDASTILKSLSIEILGFGLGLNKDGSDSLVATSLDEFNQVMKFAFDSMTKNKASDDHAGMTYEIEVIPWADNAEFLSILDFEYNRIMAPKPFGMIEDAVQIFDALTRRNRMVCSSPMSNVDDYGKCCKSHEIIKVASINELGADVVQSMCRPKQFIPPAIMKENLATNAEFIAWMSSVARDKIKSLSSLGQCISTLRSFPQRFDYYFVKSNEHAQYDQAMEMAYTVKELKAALDPAASLEIISMLGNEQDEYFEMFYQPCLSALYGAGKQNYNKASDPKFFMSEPWYNLEECSRPSCLESNKAWDRKEGNGCVDGLLGRKSADVPIPADSDPFCAVAMNMTINAEKCKYKYRPLANIVMQVDNCRDSLPNGRDGRGREIPVSMAYLMEHFCMPRLALESGGANLTKMDMVDSSWDICVSSKIVKYL